MSICPRFESCPLVAALTPDFPRALELLKQKYCSGEFQLCAIFQQDGVGRNDSLVYQKIAWVKTLIEAEISGMTKHR